MSADTNPPNPNAVRYDSVGRQLCHAHSRTGKPCSRPAVKGAKVCDFHGGKAPQVQNRIARDEAEARAAKALVKYRKFSPRNVTPSEALLEEVRRTAGYVVWLDHHVSTLTDDELAFGVSREVSSLSDASGKKLERTRAAELNVWVRWLGAERDRLVKVCAAAIAAGIEERRVSLAEQQGALLASVVERILEGVRLGLIAQEVDVAAAWGDIVREVVPRELREAGR